MKRNVYARPWSRAYEGSPRRISVYSTCIFCSEQLGRNEAIEHFPVGRRLAFDAAKGRLWVVCRKCERWNLTPLEERWEAIEECERAFSATRLRMSTEHIGLARLTEGIELVRIGAPQRPEMAAWRYGDQFGRRRRRQFVLVAGAVAAVGTVAVAGPLLGFAGVGAINPLMNGFQMIRAVYSHRKLVRVPSASGDMISLRLTDLSKARLQTDGESVTLVIPRVASRRSAWYRYEGSTETISLSGDDAVRASGIILPMLNRSGGSRADVTKAVRLLEDAGDPLRLYRTSANALANKPTRGLRRTKAADALMRLPTADRLALEMMAHEDAERRALEGELHVLEAAWQDAEEVAGIADDMFLPPSIDEGLARLKRSRDQDE